MNMQVMYQDNKIGQLDSALLDGMLDTHKIKMFMRSDGWAMVGITHTRGCGGSYAGPNRRSMYNMMLDSDYRIVV